MSTVIATKRAVLSLSFVLALGLPFANSFAKTPSLTLGVADIGGSSQYVKGFKALASQLHKQLKIAVKVKSYKKIPDFINALVNKKVDLAFVKIPVFVAASEQNKDLHFLTSAYSLTPSGKHSLTYKGLIIAALGSDVHSLSDLKGKDMYLTRCSTSGLYEGIDALSSVGLTPRDLHLTVVDQMLGALSEANQHHAADAVWDQLLYKNDKKAFRILFHSKALFHPGIVSTGIFPDMDKKLIKALSKSKVDQSLVYFSGFVPTQPHAYDNEIALIKKIDDQYPEYSCH